MRAVATGLFIGAALALAGCGDRGATDANGTAAEADGTDATINGSDPSVAGMPDAGDEEGTTVEEGDNSGVSVSVGPDGASVTTPDASASVKDGGVSATVDSDGN